MSKQSNKDLEQQKLVTDLFELLGDDIGGEGGEILQKIIEKIRNIKDINKWAINMDALDESEHYGPPDFDYAVKYALEHPDKKGNVSRIGYIGNISLLDFVFQPIRRDRSDMGEVMDVIRNFHPNMDAHIKLLVDHGAKANLSLYNFWVGLEDDDDGVYDNPDGLQKYHAIKEHLKKGLGRTAKTLQRTLRRKKKAKKEGDDVRLKLATSDNRTTKYMKDNMESSIWNKIKKGLEEDGISEADITTFKEQDFDPKWERRSESDIGEWFQEILYHLEVKKGIWRQMEQTLAKKGLSKENIKVFKNKFKKQWKLLNQFKSKNREKLGLDGSEMWDEAIEKDINKWFQKELGKTKAGTKKKKKAGTKKKKKAGKKKKKKAGTKEKKKTGKKKK